MQRNPKDGGGDIEQPVGRHGEQPQGQQYKQQTLGIGTELWGEVSTGVSGMRTGVNGMRIGVSGMRTGKCNEDR